MFLARAQNRFLGVSKILQNVRGISNDLVPGAVAPHWSLVSKDDEVKQKSLLVGRVCPTNFTNAIEVQIKKMVLDERISMYFSELFTIFAEDPSSLTKAGDTVLIRELVDQSKETITHEVVKVLYPLGDVTDPISGKKCVNLRYRSDVEAVQDAYGHAREKTFKYDEAPERGWQEGKKDFSHKVGYRKWNEFPPGHPLHNDLSAS